MNFKSFCLSLSGHKCDFSKYEKLINSLETQLISKQKTFDKKISIIQSKLDKSEENNDKLSSKLNYKPKLTLNKENHKIDMPYYNYDGNGEKPINTYLVGDYRDQYMEVLSNFTEENNFRGADDMIFKFMFWFDSLEYGYKAERKEYFEKPDEALTKYLNKTFGDCDMVTSVKFTCMYYLLYTYYPKRVNDLYAMIVNPISGGKHILCAYTKSNKITVALETTYYRHSWVKSWANNIHISDNMLYDSIDYLFNRKYAYSIISKPKLI